MSSHICDYYMWLDVQSNRILLFKLSFMFRNIDLNLIRKCFFFFSNSVCRKSNHVWIYAVYCNNHNYNEAIKMQTFRYLQVENVDLGLHFLLSVAQLPLCDKVRFWRNSVLDACVLFFQPLSFPVQQTCGQSVIVFISCSRPVRVIANDCLSHK